MRGCPGQISQAVRGIQGWVLPTPSFHPEALEAS